MIYSVLWIVAIVAIFWLLIIRPAQRRQKEIAQVQAAIEPGETVILTSGIFGTVNEVDDATVLLEVAPGLVIKVARGAVGSVIRDDEQPDALGAGDDPESPTSAEPTDNEER